MMLTKGSSSGTARERGFFADAERAVRRVFLTVGIFSLAIDPLALGLAFVAQAAVDRAEVIGDDDGIGRTRSWPARPGWRRRQPAPPARKRAGRMLDRQKHAVLIPAAQSIGALATIRSLGAAGYKVHAVALRADAIGLRSRFASHSAVHPSVGSDAFADWFRAYVRDQGIEMVVPGGGFNFLRVPVFSEYRHLFPIPLDETRLSIAASKYNLFRTLAQGGGAAGANLPPHLLANLDERQPTFEELVALGAPLFIKLSSHHARKGAGDQVIKAENAARAQDILLKLQSDYSRALIQGFAPGLGAGAFILRWGGQTKARMMHLRLHETPHTGGASSFRKSWRHDAMMADAEAKLAHIDWQGVGMVEYRWDPVTDNFALMEMNLRFWGSLHLALYAGVDFPRLLADEFFGEAREDCVEGRLNVYCRNSIPGEIGYLVSLLRDKDVAVARKIYAGIEAVALSLDPRIRNDLLYPGDRWLFAVALMRFLRGSAPSIG